MSRGRLRADGVHWPGRRGEKMVGDSFTRSLWLTACVAGAVSLTGCHHKNGRAEDAAVANDLATTKGDLSMPPGPLDFALPTACNGSVATTAPPGMTPVTTAGLVVPCGFSSRPSRRSRTPGSWRRCPTATCSSAAPAARSTRARRRERRRRRQAIGSSPPSTMSRRRASRSPVDLQRLLRQPARRLLDVLRRRPDLGHGGQDRQRAQRRRRPQQRRRRAHDDRRWRWAAASSTSASGRLATPAPRSIRRAPPSSSSAPTAAT